MMQADGIWRDYRDQWCVAVREPPKHPTQPYVLDSYGVTGQPFYITLATYKKRAKDQVGLPKGYQRLR